MSSTKKILFLYTELAGYFIACCNELVKQGAEVHIVRWPVNKEAPFQFRFGEGITVYDRSDFDYAGLQELATRIQPEAIVCSGWIDRDYVKLCNAWKKKACTVIALDNKWHGSLRQQVARIMSPFTLRRIFHFAWVPGAQQHTYARKLGFAEARIRNGFYSADVPFFSAQGEAYIASKQAHFPHRLVYAGRYYDFKGVRELWEAFIQLKAENDNDWELWCLGTGDVPPAEHPAIRHLGFVQPSEMPAVMRDTGVFVMPSRVEPWGVVLHEFAAAGFPLVCSNNVGAATQFVRKDENGIIYPAGDVNATKRALLEIISKSDETLAQMGQRSAAIAREITPATWSETLLGMMVEG